jgi:dipeptidyl aminopeptidase/acylaminoacyl peptidase
MRSRVLAAALTFSLTVAGSASASFPGRDGRLALVVSLHCEEYVADSDPCHAHRFTDIVTVAPSGRDARSITHCFDLSCPGGLRQRLAYSSDGARLAVEHYVPQDYQAPPTSAVDLLASDGSSSTSLTLSGPFVFPSAWLPGGRTIAVFAPGDVGRFGRVLLLGVDGAVRAVRGGPRGERTWSSTGRVAISGQRGIYVFDPATRRRRLILAATERITYDAPDWSPDGRRLVLVRSDGQTRLQAILTVDAAGGHRRVVLRGPTPGCDLGRPVWSPTGTRIAFTASCLDARSAATALFTVRPSGRGLRAIFEADPLIPKSGSSVAEVGPGVSWQALPR